MSSRRSLLQRFRAALLAVAFALALVGAPAAARADDQGASWQFAPAEAPPPPSGAQPSPFPVALGRVGDIEFWSPDRGVLITAGNGLVPAGLYAYDGVSWHQLASVCGGSDGRIAWAGPDEFWTISDQRPGQTTPTGANSGMFADISLCHFANGEVLASYAMPVDQPDSYQTMDAAACDGPDDCWFGGQLSGGSNAGAFHLYWNGSALSVVYSPQGHAVAAMTVEENQIYESVQLEPTDGYGSESMTNPTLLHTIAATDPSDVFHDVFPTAAGCVTFCTPLPEYGTAGGQPVAPDTLAGLALSSDWSPSGEGPASQQLWAAAGPDSTRPAAGEGSAHPIVLRYSEEEWIQIVPNMATFEAGEDPGAVAADPGEQAAWVTIQSQDEVAHVDQLSSPNGGGAWAVAEHDELGPEQGVGPRGDAGPIACPASHECWLATSQGWLFHLTDGIQLARDTDPFFDGEDGVIAYRPPDNGVPEVIPDQQPEDDSLANQQPPEAAATSTPAAEALPVKRTKKVKALVSQVRTRLMSHDVLALTFTLARSAHVQLLASRHGAVVARTPRRTLRQGRHRLELRLNRGRWPTKLDLRATPAG